MCAGVGARIIWPCQAREAVEGCDDGGILARRKCAKLCGAFPTWHTTAWRQVNAATAGGLCPTLGPEERKRQYKERGYPLEHDQTSCCVAGTELRRGQPAFRKRKGPLNRAS